MKNHGMFLFSFVLLSFCLCQLSYAELTSEQKARLEGTLQSYVPEKPIQCISDQTQAIKGAIGFLKARVPSLTGGVDLPKWMTALNRVSDHLDAAAPKPVKADYETEDGFAERLQKFEASEEFRKDLMTYFKAKFPVQSMASCSGESETLGVGLDTKNLSSNLKSISEIAAPSNSGALESKADPDLLAQSAGASEDEMRPPSLSVANLFSELIISPRYQGWNVKGKGVGELTLWPRTGLRQRVLSELGKSRFDIPMVAVNEKPIKLTQETREFFKTLPEAERVLDGSKMAYKYYFYPEAVLDPNKHDIGRPIVFYLIKDVPKNAKESQFFNFSDSQDGKEKLERFAEKRRQNRVFFEKYVQGLDLIENGKMERGLSTLKLAAKSGVLVPAVGVAAHKLGFDLVSQGKRGEAEKYYRLAADKYDHPDAQNELAFLLFQQGNLGEAEKYLHLAADKHDDPIAQYNLADLLYDQGNLGEAEKYFRLAADKHDYPRAQIDLGTLLQNQGNVAEAENYYRIAADKHDNPDAQNNLGFLYEKKNDLKQALSYYEKAATKIPMASLNLGIFHIKHKGQFGTKNHAEVMEYFKKAISSGVGIKKETNISEFLKSIGREADSNNPEVINGIQEAL